MTMIQRPSSGIVNIPGMGMLARSVPIENVAANWWQQGGVNSCIAAYRVRGALSLADSYINKANPGTHDLSVIAGKTAPVWSAANGWESSWANQTLLQTGLIPTANQTWSAIAVVKSITADQSTVFGEYGVYPMHNVFAMKINHGQVDWGNGESLTAGTVADLAAINVLALAGPNAYINGELVASSIGAYRAGSTFQIFIGANNPYNWGSVDGAFIGHYRALAFFNTVLTQAQVQAIGAAAAAL